LLLQDSALADQSEHVNSHDCHEAEMGASGGAQAIAERETTNEMALTPPQDPVGIGQAAKREVSHHIDVALSTVPVFLRVVITDCIAG